MMLENEVTLLRRFARTGDAEAFSEVVRRHAGLVYGACLRILADRDRAADAVQGTFYTSPVVGIKVTNPFYDIIDVGVCDLRFAELYFLVYEARGRQSSQVHDNLQ